MKEIILFILKIRYAFALDSFVITFLQKIQNFWKMTWIFHGLENPFPMLIVYRKNAIKSLYKNAFSLKIFLNLNTEAQTILWCLRETIFCLLSNVQCLWKGSFIPLDLGKLGLWQYSLVNFWWRPPKDWGNASVCSISQTSPHLSEIFSNLYMAVYLKLIH